MKILALALLLIAVPLGAADFTVTIPDASIGALEAYAVRLGYADLAEMLQSNGEAVAERALNAQCDFEVTPEAETDTCPADKKATRDAIATAEENDAAKDIELTRPPARR